MKKLYESSNGRYIELRIMPETATTFLGAALNFSDPFGFMFISAYLRDAKVNHPSFSLEKVYDGILLSVYIDILQKSYQTEIDKMQKEITNLNEEIEDLKNRKASSKKIEQIASQIMQKQAELQQFKFICSQTLNGLNFILDTNNLAVIKIDLYPQIEQDCRDVIEIKAKKYDDKF